MFMYDIPKTSRLHVASVAEQAGLSLTWSQTPQKQVFSKLSSREKTRYRLPDSGTNQILQGRGTANK